MKVTYGNELKKEESKYPYFGELLEDGRLVVLFVKEKEGLVVLDTSKTYNLFEFDICWEESCFTRLDNFSVTFSVP